MNAGWLARGLVAYTLLLIAMCWVIHRRASLELADGREVIASVWRDGRLLARAVVARDDLAEPRLGPLGPDDQLVFETVIGEGPVFAPSELVLALSFVAGQDGARVTLHGKSALITPDDLLVAQVYDHGHPLRAIDATLGLDTRHLATLAGERLQASPDEVLGGASWRRIRCVRRTRAPSFSSVTADQVVAPEVEGAVLAAAHHLARGLSAEGRYRYAIGAATNDDLGGYDWPRHAGATLFLVQAWALSQDPELREAALRAAAGLTRSALALCAGRPCIGDQEVVTLGASALALLAYDEIVRSGMEPGYRSLVSGLAGFLRTQQRDDGEFMHRFDLRAQRPLDVQVAFYSGESALALARAFEVTGDPADRAAASRAVAYLIGPAWRFFGNRYYFGEEHWTCVAAATLAARAPDEAPSREALDFCLRWHAYNRALQQRRGDALFDADGAVGVGPWVTPRTTPVASRCEAAIATLGAAKRAGVDPADVRALEAQVRHALAFLLRHQFRPGPVHLLRDPAAVFGGMPASEVDWDMRVDYAQHAGSAFIGWLQLPR